MSDVTIKIAMIGSLCMYVDCFIASPLFFIISDVTNTISILLLDYAVFSKLIIQNWQIKRLFNVSDISSNGFDISIGDVLDTTIH